MSDRKVPLIAALVAAAALFAGSAQARSHVDWSVSISAPAVTTVVSNGRGYYAEPAYYQPAPTYYAPAPVYYAPPPPRPVYFRPPAVVAFPPPPVWGPPPGFRHHHHHHHRNEWRGDDRWDHGRGGWDRRHGDRR